MDLLSIPSPSQGVWHLGFFPIRGYALSIIAGIVAAIWIAERRWKARGGTYGEVQDIAIWAVPFGLVGGRLYHVCTDWEKYFGHGHNPVTALYIWRGGLGIWGAVLLGALGAWIGCRHKGIRFSAMADAVAPALLVAQALGRWGNWFNQELYGRPTKLPWGLEIDTDHLQCRVNGLPTEGASCYAANGGPYPQDVLFHPTFLYECLWNLAGFALLIWLERKLRLGWGRTMAAYVMIYTVGRFWIEYLRVDNVQLNDVLGLRFNDWVSIVCFLGGAAFLWRSRKRHPGPQTEVYLTPAGE
ncbi:prolipoprotein diacylglyceryl transferase [Nocardioides montaniterrae]